MTSQKRITKELGELTKDPPEGIKIRLADESDLHKWTITLKGPSGTPYANGKFELILSLPNEYPFKPPILNFKTKIYHPNVSNDDKGSMCIGMLKSEEWKPSSKIVGVLLTAKNLLVEPNPDDAVESSIAEQYKSDRKEFDKVVKEWVKKYASG